MIEAREMVRAAVDAESLRAVADAIGVSHATVANFLNEDLTPADKTWRKVRRWMETAEVNGGADPAAELARIDAIPDPLLRVLERESYAAVLRAQGVRDVCRAALIEAEKAVDRNTLLSPLDRDAQTGETAMAGVIEADKRRNAGGKLAAPAKRPASRPAHAPKRDDQ